MVAISRFRRRDPAFSDLLPYAAMVDDGVMLLKDGSLMAGWYYAGVDSGGTTTQARNDISRQLNAALARLGTGWMIQVEAIRVPTYPYPAPDASHFPDPVSRAIDQEQRKLFEAGENSFESQYAIILTYKVQQQPRFTEYTYADPGWPESFADKALANFNASVREFEQCMANTVSLRRMLARDSVSMNGRPVKYDNLLQFIRLCLTGESHPVRLPDVPMYLDYVVSAELHHGQSPVIDDRFVNVVAIDGFPAESWPGILNALDLMSLSYRWSTRFIFRNPHDARTRLGRSGWEWLRRIRSFVGHTTNIYQNAPAVVAETDNTDAQANSEVVAFGAYTTVIVLFDTDAARGHEKAELVRHVIQRGGFGARIERLNITDAFLGSLPGNSYCNVREAVINTANLADLIPLNSVWAGEPACPCSLYPSHSPPLMQVASGSTPFRLNLHFGDLGHTFILGPHGSGKSTLAALIASQFRRYNMSQVFCFNNSLAMSSITAAVGGDHYDVGGDTRLAFCPLSELDTEADRDFAANWLEILLKMQGVSVTLDHRDAIAEHIKLFSTQPRRSLTNFVHSVQRQDIKDALYYYTTDGPMGHLLDAEEDRLALSDFMCFEIGKLVSMDDRNFVPVLYYLFWRIGRSLTGRPSLIILDEVWLTLGHEMLRDWLKTLRTANCAVVLVTESISDTTKPGVADMLKDSCPTKIFLPNDAAGSPETRDLYQKLGFNEHQIETVAKATPKRDYYVVSPAGRRLFQMPLGPLMLSFISANGNVNLKRINQLRIEHGDDWPTAWLGERGEPRAEDQMDVGRSRTRRSARTRARKRNSKKEPARDDATSEQRLVAELLEVAGK